VAAIVNGTEVSDSDYASRWPFIVAIVRASAHSQFDGQFCGGTLIDDQHVLTAAHCVTYEPDTVAVASGLRVVAKTKTLSNSDSLGTGETGARRVIEVFIHPGFGENAGDGFHNDVAVLRLAEPVSGASTVRLIGADEGALWGAGAGGVNAFVAGWGDTDPLDKRDPDSKFPATLRQTTVPLHSDATCSATVGGGYGTAFERATNLCAGTLQSGTTLGTDSCQGDSGGPLTVSAPDGYRQIGVTSWGEGCAEHTFGSYSRIDALRGWIASVPGALDGGTAIGGPGGTLSIANLHRDSGDYSHVKLAWDAPPGGTTPERYAVWRSTSVEGNPAEELVGITRATSFRTSTPPTRTKNAFTWDVRPLDADGSNGPRATVKAGPTPDTKLPSRSQWTTLVRRGKDVLVVRWGKAFDRQSGLESYQVQRRVIGRGGFVTADFTSPSSPSIRLTGLRPGEHVQTRVRAFDRAGNAGNWSATRTFTTLR
jgi:hypothetical protein